MAGACDSCRILKVRCRPQSSDRTGSCERCLGSGKQCIYTAPLRTKRKRTDVRVRELEREVAGLTGLLRNQQNGSPQVTHSNHSPMPPPSQQPHVVQARISDSIEPFQPPIAVEALSSETCSYYLRKYINDLAPQRPFVILPDNITVDELRSSRPILFHAILTASAATKDEKLGLDLNDAILKIYAEKIILNGEKSLELIQAILITTNWYCPPNRYEQLKFYQFLHMASTMASDIGLGADSPNGEVLEPSISDPPSHLALLDGYRALLACYICCSSVSISLHRENMFPFSSKMARCLRSLEESPLSTENDTVLAAWVRLQLIADSYVMTCRSVAGSADCDVNTETRRLSLQRCTNQLALWKLGLAPGILNAPISIQYSSLLCLFHESSLHHEYSPDDFRPPYMIGPLKSDRATDPNPYHSSDLMSSVIQCVSATHGICETFVSMTLDAIQCSPVHVFARLGHGVVVLAKIAVSVSLPAGSLHEVMTPDMVNVDHHVTSVVRKLSEVSARGCRMAAKWQIVISKVLDWLQDFRKHSDDGAQFDFSVQVMEPLRHLDVDSSTRRSGILESVSGTDYSRRSQPEGSDNTNSMNHPTLGSNQDVESQECLVVDTDSIMVQSRPEIGDEWEQLLHDQSMIEDIVPVMDQADLALLL